jgi:hypothetical protein
MMECWYKKKNKEHRLGDKRYVNRPVFVRIE